MRLDFFSCTFCFGAGVSCKLIRESYPRLRILRPNFSVGWLVVTASLSGVSACIVCLLMCSEGWLPKFDLFPWLTLHTSLESACEKVSMLCGYLLLVLVSSTIG